MTRAELAALSKLHVARDGIIDRLGDLANAPGRYVSATFNLNGSYRSLSLPKDYVAAQWTVELLDVERRIRAAGGTI